MRKKNDVKMTEAQKIAIARKLEIRYQNGEMKGKELLDYKIERKFIDWNENIRDKDRFLRVTPNKVYGGIIVLSLLTSMFFGAVMTQKPDGVVNLEPDYSYVYITNDDEEFMNSVFNATYNNVDGLYAESISLGYSIKQDELKSAYKSYEAFSAAYNGSSDLSKFLHDEKFITEYIGFVIEKDNSLISILNTIDVKDYIVTNYNIPSNTYDSIVQDEDSFNGFLSSSENLSLVEDIKADKEFNKLTNNLFEKSGGSTDLSFDDNLAIYDISNFEGTPYETIDTGAYIIEKTNDVPVDNGSEVASSDEQAVIEGRKFVHLNNYKEENIQSIANTLDIYRYNTFVKNIDELAPSQLILFVNDDDLSNNLALQMFIMDIYSSASTKNVKLKTVLCDENSTFEDFGFEMIDIETPTLVKFNSYGDGLALDESNNSKIYTFSDSLNKSLDFKNNDAKVVLTVSGDYVEFFNKNANQTGMTQISHNPNNEDILDIERITVADDKDLSNTTASLNT